MGEDYLVSRGEYLTALMLSEYLGYEFVDAKDLIIDKSYDSNYGARPLKRVMQSMIEDNFSEALLDGVIKSGRIALVDAEGDEIRISDAGPIEEVKVEVAKTDGANA